MAPKNSLQEIKYEEEPGFSSGKMFKWLTVLYVDPQIWWQTDETPPSGTGVGSEGKTMQATRYK